MTLPEAPAWVIWTAWAVVSLGAAIVALALLSDWARGLRGPARRRCPRCWYDMAGVAGLQCPECGRTAKAERRLLKARRRWGWAVVGLLLVIPSAVSLAYPRLAREDWLKILPSWVLVRCADPISAPQRFQTATRFGAAPTGPTRAQLMAAELAARYERAELSLDVRRRCAREQFAGSPGPVLIETRARWPAGVPMLVNVGANFRGPLPRSMKAIPRFRGASAVTSYDTGWTGDQWYREDTPLWFQPIGVPPDGATALTWDLTIAEGPDQLWSGMLTTPVTIGGAVDDVIRPTVIPAAAEAIERSLAQTARIDGESGHPWLFFEPVQMSELEGVTVGLMIEFREEGKPVAWVRTLWIQEEDAKKRQTSNWYFQSRTTERTVAIEGDTPRLESMRPGDPRWTIHVRGDGETALRDFAATKYWSGEFDMLPANWTR